MLLSDYFSVFVLNRWCRQINICAVELLIFFFFFFGGGWPDSKLGGFLFF